MKTIGYNGVHDIFRHTHKCWDSMGGSTKKNRISEGQEKQKWRFMKMPEGDFSCY